jgi:hypothetical protein
MVTRDDFFQHFGELMAMLAVEISLPGAHPVRDSFSALHTELVGFGWHDKDAYAQAAKDFFAVVERREALEAFDNSEKSFTAPSVDGQLELPFDGASA